MSLQETEKECAENAVAPRVSLSDIERKIDEKHFVTGAQALEAVAGKLNDDHPLNFLTMCFPIMDNGYMVVGKSAPASAQNFNKDLGQKLAYEDAVRQVWPLMGFVLRDRFMTDAGT